MMEIGASDKLVQLTIKGTSPETFAHGKLQADRFNDECGVMGIWNHPEAANLTYLGLCCLQHRGQEGAGIVAVDRRTADGDRWNTHRSLGLVHDVFSNFDFDRLPGSIAIGHVRYSTAGGTRVENVQPFKSEIALGQFAICHNGNLVNAQSLREKLKADGAIFSATSDTELIMHLAARASRNVPPAEAVISVLKQLEGAYALLILLNDRMYAVRDPYGLRPLVMAEVGEGLAFASETCAFNFMDVRNVREIQPGELVEVFGGRMTKSYFPLAKREPAPCIFEHVYFARPDSEVFGRHVQSVRRALGVELARECPVDADFVMPIPDSGIFAALGYAQEAKLPFDYGLIRNQYSKRTFIEPAQRIRDFGVKLKLSPNRQIIQGKRLIVVDDSLVRGTTSKKIVGMLREAGAKEVHMRISSPPTMWPCHYGIDTPDRADLIAANMTIPEIERFIGADSLGYLSLEGLHRAAESEPGKMCDACFSGQYRAGVPKDFLPKQTSLL